jgi:hypothetical protein
MWITVKFSRNTAAHESLLNNKFADALRAYKNTKELAEYDVIDMESELRAVWVQRAHVDFEDEDGWETPWERLIAVHERREKEKEKNGGGEGR